MVDIQVITIDKDTSRASFELQPKLVDGISELVQIVVLSLLNVPGRDVLDPDSGGGLPELIGLNIDTNDTNEMFAEIARRVRKTQTEIINSQIGLDLSAEKKLRDLQILELAPGGQPDEIFVRIRVINEAGRQTDIVL